MIMSIHCSLIAPSMIRSMYHIINYTPIACIHASFFWLCSLIHRLYHSCSFDCSHNRCLRQPLILPLLPDPSITPWTIAPWPIACSLILLSPSSAQCMRAGCPSRLVHCMYHIMIIIRKLYYLYHYYTILQHSYTLQPDQSLIPSIAPWSIASTSIDTSIASWPMDCII